jgi:hypothetical protein
MMVCGNRVAASALTLLVAGCQLDAPVDGVAAAVVTSEGEDAGAGFDFGGDCSSGTGAFTQFVARNASTVVGEIPINKRNVRVDLRAIEDVDIQLVDKATGHEIVAWPYGDLSGPRAGCASYGGVQYCYSGYNGTGSNLGYEWIEVRGDTNRALAMRVFGYTAGTAQVEYSWQAVDTCREIGSGSFLQEVPYFGVTTVGTIPPGKVNVQVALTSSRDLDVQLFDGATAIVKWPDGLLNGPTTQSVDYRNMRITWSGFNGDGVRRGNEFIRIDGAVTRGLSMRVFGYQAGVAQVDYQWGAGAGAACGASGLPLCRGGLFCKAGDGGDIARGIPGACHSANWCASDASAADDCAGQPRPPQSGEWTCEEFECTWKTRASCSSNAQCGASQYCDDGLCRGDGSCAQPADCVVDGNDWDSGACIATHRWQATCDNALCGFLCVPL